jgi:hypothetical protein
MSEPTPTPEPTPVEPTPQPEPTPTPEPVASWVNDDGTFNRDRFADDIGSHSIFDKYANIEDFVNGSINAQKLVSQKVDDWLNTDNEEVIREKMRLSNVPDSAKDYDFDLPETFMDLSEEHRTALMANIEEYKEFAHGLGVSEEQFKQFVERDIGKSLELHFANQLAEKEAYLKENEAVKKDWGHEFDNNVARTESMAKLLGMEAMIPFLKENPLMMQSFHDGARKIMSNDKIVEHSARQSVETTRDSRNDLVDKMMNYKGSTNDPQYQRWQEQLAGLQSSIPNTGESFPVIGM